MLKTTEIVPKNLRNVVPEICHGRTFVKIAEGMEFNITGIAINVYPAKDDEGEPIVTKDGTQIMKRTGYFTIGSDAYGSVTGYTAVSQLASCEPTVLDTEDEGSYAVSLTAPIKVKIIKISEKMGKQSYDYLAFEPQ